MGDLIQFPYKIPEPQDPEQERLRRIQTALARINELMRRLKNERDTDPRD